MNTTVDKNGIIHGDGMISSPASVMGNVYVKRNSARKSKIRILKTLMKQVCVNINQQETLLKLKSLNELKINS